MNPLCVLGRELQQRGNKVTFLGIPEFQKVVESAGLDYRVIGKEWFPIGSFAEFSRNLGVKKGLDGLKDSINWFKKNSTALFQEAPKVLEDASVNALIIDQTTPAGVAVADYTEIPYVITSTALLFNRESRVPPFFTNWDYNPALWARLRNHLTNTFFYSLTKSLRNYITEQRKLWKLPTDKRRTKRNANYLYENQLAQISQIPKEFDFPRMKLPSCFHYTGPFIDPSGFEPTLSPSVSFPYEKLNDKPLIYASLGTIQNQEKEYFETIANACVGLDIQLIISLGGTDMNPSDYNLRNALAVPFAPHQQLIKRSDLVITHGGLNTVLGALAEAKPMVAIPITNEQPGIAARIKRCGAGEVVPLKNLHAGSLREIIRLVLKEDKYKHNAKQLQHAIERAGGARRAAEIIELAISTSKPVLSGQYNHPLIDK